MNLERDVSILRKASFFLFLIPTIGLFLSIFSSNYLATHKYSYESNYYDFVDDIPGSNYQTICNKQNNYCLNTNFIESINKKGKKLNDCRIYHVHPQVFLIDDLGNKTLVIDNGGLPIIKDSKSGKYKVQEKLLNNDFILSLDVKNKLNIKCIKNYKINFLYEKFPDIFELQIKLTDNNNLKMAVGETINPFIYGETSISNLVKRFPINYIFKSLIYLSVILMIIYWSFYNKILRNFKKEFKVFYYFGILSAVTLFFHVMFLGSTSKNELFQDVRKIIIVSFIVFELLAQVFLTKYLYKNKDLLKNFCKRSVIFLKVYFILFVIIVTTIILITLLFYNMPSNVDNILEWNYFLFLLIFYFLSFFMWKKN
tara:strand:- start:482 stop:1588 length:1107 start_codon:yes stop_codon:yes gene_type:complete